MTSDAKPEPADQPAAQPRGKRRWYQFSLRAMFVWVTVIAVLLTVGLRWIAPAQRQRAAVQMVERVDGSVRYIDPPDDEGRLTIWAREWLPRDYFDAVDRVSCSNVTDTDLQYLSCLEILVSLSLFGTQVTDTGLAHLSGLTKLERLDLDGTQVTDTGLVNLSGLTELVILDLEGTQVTDAGLAHLSGLTKLKRLHLNGTQVTDAGLAHLSGLMELKRLDLNDTQVTDAGLADLRNVLPKCQIYVDREPGN